VDRHPSSTRDSGHAPGTRFYLFEGGCVRYRFRFQMDERAKPLGAATLALGLVRRDALSSRVLDDIDGRYRLDP
jgi:hypothetical protein